MRHIHYYIYIVAAMLTLGSLTACMDSDWDTPEIDGTEFGNQRVEETNVVTIAQLKRQYNSVISDGDYQQITKNMQIKGVVTGNDIEGNIYNQVAVDDGTGAIIICIAQGGLCGILPVGQEILVELRGLYIGGYGKQPEIGTPYTNANGRTYVSRMARALWNEHYKLLEKNKSVEPVEFDKSKVGNATYMAENCGKLMTIKDVKFQGANGTRVYSTSSERDAGGSVNRYLQGVSTNSLAVRTSAYADFAAKPLPQGTVDITGIFTRYNNTWQVLIRQESDVVEK